MTRSIQPDMVIAGRGGASSIEFFWAGRNIFGRTACDRLNPVAFAFAVFRVYGLSGTSSLGKS